MIFQEQSLFLGGLFSTCLVFVFCY